MSDVLFVCVHNAGRSQMAKAFFNHLAQQRGLPLRAGSAGTDPGDRIHPEVVAVMNELGLDLSREHPALLTNDMAKNALRVITMGCAVDSNACPAVLIKGVEDWGLPDPKGRPIRQLRGIRNQIKLRVETLLDELTRPVTSFRA